MACPAGPAGAAPPAPEVVDDRALSPAWHAAAQLLVLGALRLLGWLPLTILAVAVAWLAPDVADRLLAWLYGAEVGGRELALALAVPVVALPVALLVSALALRQSGKVAARVVGRWGPASIRIWLKTGAVAGAGQWLSGSLFWPLWLRLAGMRIGRRCEVSTIIDVLPETVSHRR